MLSDDRRNSSNLDDPLRRHILRVASNVLKGKREERISGEYGNVLSIGLQPHAFMRPCKLSAVEYHLQMPLKQCRRLSAVFLVLPRLCLNCLLLCKFPLAVQHISATLLS